MEPSPDRLIWDASGGASGVVLRNEGHLDLLISCYHLKPWCTTDMYVFVDPDTYHKQQTEVFDHSCSLVSGFLENLQFSP